MTRKIQNEIQKMALCDAAKNAVLPRFPRRVTHASYPVRETPNHDTDQSRISKFKGGKQAEIDPLKRRITMSDKIITMKKTVVISEAYKIGDHFDSRDLKTVDSSAVKKTVDSTKSVERVEFIVGGEHFYTDENGIVKE